MSTMEERTFNYVLIGGGTAGLAVAARLTEDPTITVCVLEAGEDVTKQLDFTVPGFGFKNLGPSKVNWGLSTVPQVNAKDRSLYLPRGKALGGSSMINLMTLGRGHEAEYNAFASLGSPGWDWKGMVEYFRLSETFAPTTEEISKFEVVFNAATHGTRGPLQRTLPTWISELQAPVIRAMRSLGVPYNPDGASGNNVGVWTSNHSIDTNGARSSSASAYYEPNKSRTNLVVITGAQATRVIFRSSKDASGNLIASAVEYSKDGQVLTVSTTEEVLLCAGALKTPQLLELSGIGDEKVLKDKGVHLELNLPGVGANLQDHFWCLFVSETDSKYESVEVLNNPVRAAEEWKLYDESKRGMLSGIGSTLLTFLPKEYFMEGSDRVLPEQIRTSLYQRLENIQKGWLGEGVPFLEIGFVPGFLPIPGHKAEEGKSYCSFFLALTHPFSSGTVHIASSDPFASPAIDHCVLDNELDIEILVHAIKFTRKLADTPDLSSVLTKEVIPGPEVQTDEEIKDFIRGSIDTVFHPIGTAAMLPREEGGVVGASLKVYGTSNLRVVDASIIPIQLSAHIQATVYAIAEKAAAIIKHERQHA
ncbi:alcohol oxidase [Mycena alexandri]|uniref:Alcohol oxidase n=1 Tax=Mycena alexandri TaxID=1745969 RepID=A0AAD6S3J8_9AGAR|nr:alcohol oxidase [Mycena alexandri]